MDYGNSTMDIRITNPNNIELKGNALQFFNDVNNGTHEINMYWNTSNQIKDLLFTRDSSFLKLKKTDENTYKVI